MTSDKKTPPKKHNSSKVNLSLAILKDSIKVGLSINSHPDCIGDMASYVNTLSDLGNKGPSKEKNQKGKYFLMFNVTPSFPGSKLVKKLMDSKLPRKNVQNNCYLFDFEIDPLNESENLIYNLMKRIKESNTPKPKILTSEEIRNLTDSRKKQQPQKTTQPITPEKNHNPLDITQIINPEIYNILDQEVISTLNKTNLILWEKYGIDPKKIYSKHSENNVPLGRAIVCNILSIKEKMKNSTIAKIINVTTTTAYHSRDTFSSMPIDYNQDLEDTIDHLISVSLGTRGIVKKLKNRITQREKTIKIETPKNPNIAKYANIEEIEEAQGIIRQLKPILKEKLGINPSKLNENYQKENYRIANEMIIKVLSGKGFSNKQLIEILGVSQSTICNGKNRFSQKATTIDYNQSLNQTVDFLLASYTEKLNPRTNIPCLSYQKSVIENIIRDVISHKANEVKYKK